MFGWENQLRECDSVFVYIVCDWVPKAAALITYVKGLPFLDRRLQLFIGFGIWERRLSPVHSCIFWHSGGLFVGIV